MLVPRVPKRAAPRRMSSRRMRPPLFSAAVMVRSVSIAIVPHSVFLVVRFADFILKRGGRKRYSRASGLAHDTRHETPDAVRGPLAPSEPRRRPGAAGAALAPPCQKCDQFPPARN